MPFQSAHARHKLTEPKSHRQANNKTINAILSAPCAQQLRHGWKCGKWQPTFKSLVTVSNRLMTAIITRAVNQMPSATLFK